MQNVKYKSDSGRHPLAILTVTISLLIPVLLSFDQITPILFFFLGLLNLRMAGTMNWERYFKTLSILSLVGVGLFLLNVLFPAEGVDGVSRGTAVFLRSTCLISLSVGYIFLVDPYDLIRTLMTDLKLPPRMGFAFFAGWNAIPLLKRDLGIIQKAHAVRFAGRRRSFQEYLKTAVVLLAGAVRHGERVTLSMAARGIEDARNRTFIKQVLWTKVDTLYTVLGCVVALTAGIARLLSETFIFELG